MEIIGVTAIVLMVAIIVLCWNIFAKSGNLIANYAEKYEEGVETDFNNADELKNVLKTKCYGITEIKILTTSSLEVYTNNGKHIIYLEDGRLKAEFPDIPLGISRIRTFIFTFTAAKKIQQAKDLSDILECAKSQESTLSEFEKHQNDTSISKIKKYSKLLYVSVIALIVIFVGFAIYDGMGNSESTDFVDVLQTMELVDTGYTHKEAFHEFFENPKWEYFESEDGRNIVEFTGECEYWGEYGEFTLQYEMYENEDSYYSELCYMGFEGESLGIDNYYNFVVDLCDQI